MITFWYFMTILWSIQTTKLLQSGSLSEMSKQYYSRQILTLGENVQTALANSHVVVAGTGALSVEVAKNLALAGFGKLTITRDDKSLVSSLKSMSPQINVELCSDINVLSNDNVSALLICDENFENLQQVNDNCRSKGVKMIACSVRGVCGYIFSDFLDNFSYYPSYQYDTAQEVMIHKGFIDIIDPQHVTKTDNNSFSVASTTHSIPHQNMSISKDMIIIESILLRVETDSLLNGKRIEFNTGNVVDILYGGEMQSYIVVNISQNNGKDRYLYELKKVYFDISACRENTTLSLANAVIVHDMSRAIEAIDKGKGVMRLRNMPVYGSHASLKHLLQHPVFSSHNACQRKESDDGLSNLLLSAFVALDAEHHNQVNSTILQGDFFCGVTKDQCDNSDQGNKQNGYINRNKFISSALKRLKALQLRKNTDNILNEHKRSKNNVMTSSDCNVDILTKFLRSSSGQCPSAISVVAALAAQEVIKACSKAHAPISQFLLYEALDSLPEHDDVLDDYRTSKSAGVMKLDLRNMKNVYGTEIVNCLNRLKVFTVGCGAIGCELLKLYAQCGIATFDDKLEGNTLSSTQSDKAGSIDVTDSDAIELSNLSRQYLFRSSNIGWNKAITAAQSIRKMFPKCRVRPYTIKVGEKSIDTFNANFWENIDVVVSAVDNVEARRYIDRQAVRYGRCMVDTGTLGLQASTQIILPHITESYNSFEDSPHDQIPLCTIKSFPFKVEHCIAWSKSMFDLVFHEDVETFKSLRFFPSNVTTVVEILFSDAEKLSRVEKDILLLTHINDTNTSIVHGCVVWAYLTFDQFYREYVENTLKDHPVGSLDEEGELFWTKERRIPSPQSYDFRNINHHNFLVYATRLKALTLGHDLRVEEVRAFLDGIYNDLLSWRGRTFEDILMMRHTDASLDSIHVHRDIVETENRMIVNMSKKSISINAFKHFQSILKPLSFDKDAYERGDIDFILAASNIRCDVYGIRNVDKFEVKKISGSIIPATVTSTAFVAGLAMAEIIKISYYYLKGKGNDNIIRNSIEAQEIIRKKFRNSFSDLSSSFVTFTESVEASLLSGVEEMTGAGVNNYTLWDYVEMDSEDCKLRFMKMSDILSLIADKYHFIVETISVDIASKADDNLVLYSKIFHDYSTNNSSDGSNVLSSVLEDVLRNNLFVTSSCSEEESADSLYARWCQNMKYIDLVVEGYLEGKASDGDDVDNLILLPRLRVYLTDDFVISRGLRCSSKASTWSQKSIFSKFSKMWTKFSSLRKVH